MRDTAVTSLARSLIKLEVGALTERRTVWDFAPAALREQSPSDVIADAFAYVADPAVLATAPLDAM